MSRSFSECVLIGRVVRPQGRKGEVVVEPLSDRPERFPSLKRALAPAADGSARELLVDDCWPHKGRFVLKLRGVDSIDAAEALRGAPLAVGEEELAPLPPDSYYFHELVGLGVETASGARLGVVEELLETGATVVLVVRDAGRETLVPLARPFLRAIDTAARRLVVELPETLEVS